MRTTDLFVLILIAFLFPGIGYAQEDQEDTSPYSSAELLSEFEHVQPGTPFTLALKLTMDPGWHSYWQNPGDSGEPTEIIWDLPSSFDISPMQWPYPHSIDLGPLRSYGYADEVLLLTEVTSPDELSPGTDLEINATAYWLICAEICLPAEEDISLTLPVSTSAPSLSPEASSIVAERSKLPVEDTDWTTEVTHYAGSYVLQVTPPSNSNVHLEGAYFFASDYETIDHPAVQPVTREGDTYLIALQQSEYATGQADRMRGVLVAAEGSNWGFPALAVDAPVSAPLMSTSQTSGSVASLPWMLLFAFAGGLLLNLMPCVFPVISIKILGFAQQGDQDPRSTRLQGYAFGFGVLISFLLLAGLFLALRAAGNQIGWGFQLQSPGFVAGMALLFFGIGLNLLGVFEMGSGLMRLGGAQGHPQQTHHLQRSFWDGALATLVATPCTAPFMGAALGAAIVLPTVQALLIFAFLGIGMALPYVVLSTTPALVRRLPKPGPWMEVLKHVLAFPMFATTLWLAWVFGRQTGVDGLALLLLGILLLGLSLWILGRWPSIQIPARIRLLTRSLSIVALLLCLSAVYMGTTYTASSSTLTEETSNWAPFSTQEVSQLRSEGQPVFIDFTAAWCLTCQVNKKTTLNNTAVQDAFKQKGVTLFQADWTHQDEEITRALEEHGRSGVPLYVLYTDAEQAPIILPEILTEQIVLDALSVLPDKTLTQNLN